MAVAVTNGQPKSAVLFQAMVDRLKQRAPSIVAMVDRHVLNTTGKGTLGEFHKSEQNEERKIMVYTTIVNALLKNDWTLLNATAPAVPVIPVKAPTPTIEVKAEVKSVQVVPVVVEKPKDAIKPAANPASLAPAVDITTSGPVGTVDTPKTALEARTAAIAAAITAALGAESPQNRGLDRDQVVAIVDMAVEAAMRDEREKILDEIEKKLAAGFAAMMKAFRG